MTWAMMWSEQAAQLFQELLKVEPNDGETGCCLYCDTGLGHKETCPWLRGRLLLGFGKDVR